MKKTAKTSPLEKRYSLVLVILYIVCFNTAVGQEKYIVSITNERGILPQDLHKYSFEITNVTQKSTEIIVDLEQYHMLGEMGYKPLLKCSEEELKANLERGKMLDGYKSYDEILTILQGYANDYPDICQLYDIGNSLGKYYWDLGYTEYEDYQHDIWALKISDNPGIEEDEPCLLFDGGHHARETIGPAVVMNFMQHLLENYGTITEVTDAIDKNQIWIVPLVNPDGYKIVIDSLEVWWRKTIRDNNDNQQIDPFIPDWIEPDGVDPNRNYGTYWGGDWPTAMNFKEGYRGPHSFSEPCVRAMRDLMRDHHFVTELTYHSYGEKFFFPWSYNPSSYQTPDHNLYSSLGGQLAGMTPALGTGSYQAYPSGTFIMISGTTMDYAYGRHGIIAYCVELAQAFIPPPEEIQTICDAHLESQMFLNSRVHYSILTGHVTDGDGIPIEASIFIEGIDNNPGDRYDYRSDQLFGSFYRMLNPGEYIVTISAFGYQSQTHDITISNTEKTILEVSLLAEDPIQLVGTISDENNQPIHKARIFVENTPLDTLESDTYGSFDQYPFYPGEYEFRFFAEGHFCCDTSILIEAQGQSHEIGLQSYELIDFENDLDEQHFNMWGHFPWTTSTEYAYSGDHSLAAPYLFSNQHSAASINLFFETDKLMSLATRVSFDSVAQGMAFTMDEQLMAIYTWEQDWVTDTFYVPAGFHRFRWELSRTFQTPAGGYENKCWIDKIEFRDFNTSIQEKEIDRSSLFTVFPNPSNGITTIQLNENVGKVYFAGIYDIAGRYVKTISINPAGSLYWEGNSNAGLSVPDGIYFIRLVTDCGICSKKIIRY